MVSGRGPPKLRGKREADDEVTSGFRRDQRIGEASWGSAGVIA